MTTILMIRFSSIGDILLTTPLIRQVRKKYPDARIDFLIKSEFNELVSENPHLDRIITYDSSEGFRGLRRIRDILYTEKYSCIFDLHNNFRSNYIRRFLRADMKCAIHKDKLAQQMLVRFKKNMYSRIVPIPERYGHVASPAGVSDDGGGLEFFPTTASEEFLIDKMTANGISVSEPYILIAPGAGFYTKRWPETHFIRLIEKIVSVYPWKIVIIGGVQDREIGRRLIIDRRVIDLTGQLTLMSAGSCIKHGKALISNDTGLMHMAAAVGTPVLAIFGSTVREFGFFPYRSRSLVMENNDLNCRPCSHIGRHNCPLDHFKCMRDIAPDQVFKGLNMLLQKDEESDR